jgi:hypothetical protein
VGDISYTPTFRNVDYVDGTDRVKAEGDTGFNARFAAIESDLAQLSTVAGQIDAKLDQLESPPPVTRRIVLPLRLLKTGTALGWVPSSVGAEVSPGQGADGSMNLVLPDGVLLNSLRATGLCINVSLTVSLSRVPISGGGSPQELTSLTVNTIPFDLTKQIEDTTLARVDTGTFNYRIRATVGAGGANLVSAVITGLHVTVTG